MSERDDENRENNELERWPLRFREPEIPKNDPFRNDKLERKKYADLLTQLLRRTETPLVLGLDSDWGTGKTTFAKMWQKQLELGGFKTLYFNAWETDYVAEPLVALVGELDIARGEKADEKFEKVKTAAGAVLGKIVPVIVRVATQGLVDIKNKDVEEALGELAEHTAEESIDAYRSQKNELCRFREALEDLLDEIRGDQPLVFFIDELDRCRPTFAVELLERIKHLFEVEGMVFVLVMNREQLAHSVRGLYGGDFDARSYLGRFLDLSFSLPAPRRSRYGRHLLQGIDSRTRNIIQPDTLVFLMDFLGFSLRNQERCVVRALLVGRASAAKVFYDNPVVPASIVLAEWCPKLFRTYVYGKAGASDLLEKLEAFNPGLWKASDDAAWIEASFLGLELSQHDGPDRRPIAELTPRLQKHIENRQADPEWAGRIAEIYEKLKGSGTFRRARYVLDTIVEAVDLTKGFESDSRESS